MKLCFGSLTSKKYRPQAGRDARIDCHEPFLQLLCRKALDFANGAPINKNNIGARELDHLYACGFLKVGRDDPLPNRALNCALISSVTNRNKSGSAPSVYIARRAEAANLGDEVVRWRLATHLIPYEELLADDYETFLNARAALIEADMKALCQGMEPTP